MIKFKKKKRNFIFLWGIEMDKLNNIWSLFQNLDGFVYASDVETYEMVYLNRKAMDTLGVKSIDDIYKMPKETQNYVPKVMKYYKG